MDESSATEQGGGRTLQLVAKGVRAFGRDAGAPFFQFELDARIQGPIRCVPLGIQAEAACLDGDRERGQSIVRDGKLTAALFAAFNDEG